MEQITVKPGDSGQRLDKYLGKYLKEAPRSFLYKMMRKKNITLNGKKAQGNEILKEKDEIRLFLAAETIEKFRGSMKEEGVHGTLDIPYEDDQVLFVNKPAGMLSQKASREDVSLVEYIAGYLQEKEKRGEERGDTFRLQSAGPEYQRPGGSGKDSKGASGSVGVFSGTVYGEILSDPGQRQN